MIHEFDVMAVVLVVVMVTLRVRLMDQMALAQELVVVFLIMVTEALALMVASVISSSDNIVKHLHSHIKSTHE